MQTQILFNIHPNVLLDISTSSIREPHCSQTTQHKKLYIVEKAVIEFSTPSILTIQRYEQRDAVIKLEIKMPRLNAAGCYIVLLI